MADALRFRRGGARCYGSCLKLQPQNQAAACNRLEAGRAIGRRIRIAGRLKHWGRTTTLPVAGALSDGFNGAHSDLRSRRSSQLVERENVLAGRGSSAALGDDGCKHTVNYYWNDCSTGSPGSGAQHSKPMS